IPAGIVAVILAGTAFYFLKDKPQGTDDPIIAPAPAPTPTPAPIPEATPTPVKLLPTPLPYTVKEVTVGDLASLADQGALNEKAVLTGEFRVSSAADRIVIARPTEKTLSSQVRVTATFPSGTRLPAESSTVQWGKDSGLIVRGVRKGNDGQLNIMVEKER
ncbi:MAG TPA: hypothetical protein VFG14_08455, partial [Chthoniobacteraceae bacterium]|nr:hypothetical protein [Chthoniobacteraceae bacterium]